MRGRRLIFLSLPPEEKKPFFQASLCFFCLLLAYYLLRPLQSAISQTRLFQQQQAGLTTLAAVLMFTVTPLYGALAASVSRKRLVLGSYAFFGMGLLGFFLYFWQTHPVYTTWTARGFWVWANVFNMFVVSVFWDVMVDVFRSQQGTRVFVWVGIAGSMGAVVGSLASAQWNNWAQMHPWIPSDASLLGSLLFFGVAGFFLYRLAAQSQFSPHGLDQANIPPGTHALSGFSTVFSSKYLLAICAYMVLFGLGSGLLYLQQRQLVVTLAENYHYGWSWVKTYNAYVDLAGNLGGLLLQLSIARALLRKWGVGVILALLPGLLLVMASVLYLVSWKLGNSARQVNSLLLLVSLGQVLLRMTDFSMAKPARKLLFTVVNRDAKYNAQSFIDTFVHRSSDVALVWGVRAFQLLPGVAVFFTVTHEAGFLLFAGIPLWVGWFSVAVWLGNRYERHFSAKHP